MYQIRHRHVMRSRQGFTVIELLVVFSIIFMLSMIILSALGTARAKTRDARRMADMKVIESALELYFSDNAQYPYCTPGSSGSLADGIRLMTCLSSALVPNYMPVVPQDPKYPASTYQYDHYCKASIPDSINPVSVTLYDQVHYRLWAVTELAQPTAGDWWSNRFVGSKSGNCADPS